MALTIFTSFCLIGCGGGSPTVASINSDWPGEIISIPEDANLLREGWRTCGQYRVSPDNRPNIKPEDQEKFHETIRKAMDAWNYFLGFELFVEVPDAVCVPTDFHMRLTQLSSDERITLGRALYKSPGASDLWWCACAIEIDPLAIGNWRVLAHEMGHCLGLGHSNNQASLMYKYSYMGLFTQEIIDLVANNSEQSLLGIPKVFVPACSE